MKGGFGFLSPSQKHPLVEVLLHLDDRPPVSPAEKSSLVLPFPSPEALVREIFLGPPFTWSASFFLISFPPSFDCAQEKFFALARILSFFPNMDTFSPYLVHIASPRYNHLFYHSSVLLFFLSPLAFLLPNQRLF